MLPGKHEEEKDVDEREEEDDDNEEDDEDSDTDTESEMKVRASSLFISNGLFDSITVLSVILLNIESRKMGLI